MEEVARLLSTRLMYALKVLWKDYNLTLLFSFPSYLFSLFFRSSRLFERPLSYSPALIERHVFFF